MNVRMDLAPSTFSQRQILLFWLPLAASWGLMGVEGPILQAAIARLPNMEIQLAAFGIVQSLEIAIESPVIMLLATSTALATNARNYLTLRRFMVLTNILVTVVAVFAAFTPLYRLIVREIMGIPTDIADAAQPGMKIMLFWAAAIGLRRFLQGVLIRHGQTRWIGYGTVVRLFASAGTGIALATFTSLPGVYVASTGLMSGVISEALFIAYVARPTVRMVRQIKGDDDKETVTFGDVTRYHLPLAATSLLTLLVQPVISAGLARMPYPVETLAAWPVIWGILFIFRSPALALPEAVIALLSERGLVRSMRIFCRMVGIASAAGMAFFTLTPILGLYLKYVAGLPVHLSCLVLPGIVLTISLPFINAIHSWYRGLLMARHLTRVIYWGMGISLAFTTVLVLIGVQLNLPGIATAAIALTASFLAEIFYLRSRLSGDSAVKR
jgi:progressive ankylosis protein